jgi:O-antigen/teichoic acid export membrane protein
MRRDLVISAAGIGAGQFIVLLSTPVLARIYTPAQFGVYAAIVSCAAVIASVSSLRFDSAIPVVPAEDVSAISRLALILPVVVGPMVVSIVTLLPEGINQLKLSLTDGAWFAIAVVAVMQGVTATANSLCTRRGDFVLAALIKVVQPIAFAATAWLLVRDLSFALAISWIVALLVGLRAFRGVGLVTGWRDSTDAYRRAWRYPVIFAPVSLLDTLTQALPLLAIVSIFGGADGGNYSQVQRLIGAPLMLVGLAVGQVFLKHAGDLIRTSNSLTPLFLRVLRNLALLACLIVTIVVVAGDWALALFLGHGWRTDTMFLVLVILPVVFRTIVSPLSSVFLLHSRIGLAALWQATYFLVTASVIFFGRSSVSLDYLLAALVCSEFLMYSVYFFLAYSLVRRVDRRQVGLE